MVTAVGQVIGRASAIAMARAGAKVYATDVNMDVLSTIRSDNIKLSNSICMTMKA